MMLRQTLAGGKVRIDVIDHGEGIPPESLPYVWDRYYKVDKSHKRTTVGAGLGLSIVKGVLEAHGAEYGVESTPGRGSDFWFCLPCLKGTFDETKAPESDEKSFDFS